MSYMTEIILIKITMKETFGSMFAIMICLLALCVIFYCEQDLPPYLKNSTTALVTAMLGGVAAGVYLNFIGLRTQKNE